MSGQAPPSLQGWSFELSDWLAQLRERTLLCAMPVLYGVGALLLAGIEVLQQPFGRVWAPLGAFALALALLVWRRRNPILAGWLLTLGSLLLVLAIVAWWGLAPVICLLAAPAGLAFLTVSTEAGLAMAAACTLLLALAPGSVLAASSLLRVAALATLWTTAGMVQLVLHPLVATVQWAWSNYQDARVALERARDYQIQAREALQDLSLANAQLTRLNQLNDALRRSAEDERRAKEQFVANVSHELRTPLNMIIGFSEMISESPEVYGGVIPPALLADLGVVLRNSQHLSALIDDVLDLSQIEAGRMALTKERTSLPAILESAATAARPLYESKHLYLEVELTEDLPPVYCDRTRIHEVVLNLLSNAGRFTERGGVHVKARREGNGVVVSVTDTGMGIAEEDRTRLFQPFQQLDGTIRRRYGGTGLGLSISKSFVELHGGEMWIESERGRGTTVSFRIPLEREARVDPGTLRWFSPYQREVGPARRSRLEAVPLPPRLAVVEKGDVMRRLLTRYLGDREVVPAATVEDALDKISSTPAQALLINDTSMHGALERLQETPALPAAIPAIICSVPGVEAATGALGVKDYLVKPVSREALLGSLDSLGKEIRTILLVDDEQDALLLFSRMLSGANRGYRLLRACDGRQALQMLREDRPDVVMLDLVMPEVSGFEFLERKAEDPMLREIPVILVSARDPFGQPIVSNALTVTRANGLSVRDLLMCIEAVSAILSPVHGRTDRALRAGPPG